MEILMGKHALEQARERGITTTEVKKTIQRGAKHLQSQGKIVSDYMHLRVVYKKIETKNFVITVMIRR